MAGQVAILGTPHPSLGKPWLAKRSPHSLNCTKPPLIYTNCTPFTKPKSYINIPFSFPTLFSFPHQRNLLHKTSSSPQAQPPTPKHLQGQLQGHFQGHHLHLKQHQLWFGIVLGDIDNHNHFEFIELQSSLSKWVFLLTKTHTIPSITMLPYLVHLCPQNHIFNHQEQPPNSAL